MQPLQVYERTKQPPLCKGRWAKSSILLGGVDNPSVTLFACFAYIFGKMPGKLVLNIIRIIGGVLIFFGAALPMDIAWGIADIAQCILAFINIPVCAVIGSVAYMALKNYVTQRKQGIEPHYIAAENSVKQPTDFWK